MVSENKTLNKTTPVKFTASAIAEVKKLAANEGDKFLRIGAKNGGCSGFSYIFEFDTPTETDELYEIDGLKVVIDSMHLLHIKDVTVNYEQGLNNRGFTFTNPNASETCGCGTSFS